MHSRAWGQCMTYSYGRVCWDCNLRLHTRTIWDAHLPHDLQTFSHHTFSQVPAVQHVPFTPSCRSGGGNSYRTNSTGRYVTI